MSTETLFLRTFPPLPLPKKHTALLFSGLLVLPLLLVLGLQAFQAFWKWQAKERLEEEAHVILELPAASLVWEKRDKELRIGDRLFDVAALTISGGTARVTGIWDEQEREIEGWLQKHSHSGGPAFLLRLLLVLQGLGLALAAAVLYWWPKALRIVDTLLSFQYPFPWLPPGRRPPCARLSSLFDATYSLT